jgi:hypothetical protein
MTPQTIKEPRFSVVTNDRDPLSKTLSSDPTTGEVVKGGKCSMTSGTIRQKTVSSLNQFAEGLRRLKPQQALVHGIAEYTTAFVVTASQLRKARDGRPVDALPIITRTKDYIDYPDGPGLLMFDHDRVRSNSVAENEAALQAYKPAELIETIAKVFPEIASTGWVSTPSTSACIFSPTGEELRGEGSGFHLYIFVKNCRDIPRFLKVLGQRLFIAGFGRVELSRSGTLLFRTLIDLLVGSPERLDFAAGAVCEDGLMQRLPAPIVKEGPQLNTALLHDLTASEEAEYGAIKARLAELAKPGQTTVKEKYIGDEAAKLSTERLISEDDARKIIEARQNHILLDGDLLYFAHLKGKAVTVAEVLNNPTDFDKKPLADPLEPEYDGGSLTKARFYWNDGRPIINSFCHGSVKYTFARFQTQKPGTDFLPKDKPWFEDALKAGSVARFIDKEPPTLDWVFKGTLLARTTGLLVGPGAAGKSTLALLMLVAVATGRDILPGIFTPTKAGKVLGVFAEDDETIIHHRLHAIANALFFDDEPARELLRQNMMVVSTTGHDVRFLNQSFQDLSESPFFKEVFEAIKLVDDLRLIILDPVSRYHGAEENDNGAGTYLVSLLEKIAQQTHAAVLALHHVGKRAGSEVHGFDLDAAMHQDASRGASGLTNGVRWQCNLFGLPEKNAKKSIGVSSSEPGQYLALKVCKKNYGAPESVFFLERLKGGMLKPVERTERTVEADLSELVKGLVLDAVMKSEGQFVTQRILLDGNCRLWKENDSRISRRVVDQTVASCILNHDLFERKGKNASGKTISCLSKYPEASANSEPERTGKMNLEPEGEPEGFEPEEPEGSGKNNVPARIRSKSLNKVKPEKVNRKNDPLRIVSPRYCETVEPEISSPYGGNVSPSGLNREVISLIPEDGKTDAFEEFTI